MAETASTTRQKCWRKACKWCHDVHPMKRRQRYCSNTCSAEAKMWRMTKDEKRQQAAKASAMRVALQRERRFGDLMAKVKEMLFFESPETEHRVAELLETAYQRGYQSGYNKGVDRRDRRRGEAA